MQKNDMVMHPSQGVCKITDIRSESFSGEDTLYYVAEPVYGKEGTTIFVPVNSDRVQLRKMLNKEDIYALIGEVQKAPEIPWNNDDRARQREFAEILKQGNHLAVMRMLAAIWNQRKALGAKGKKLHVFDERIMENAENLLHQEFAYALSIEPKEVAPFILGEIKRK